MCIFIDVQRDCEVVVKCYSVNKGSSLHEFYADESDCKRQKATANHILNSNCFTALS